MKRKLVTIQEIKEVVPIEGADNIEIVKIMGWQCVAKKGEFKVGDKCVYFEVDSYLPIEENYEFLRSSSYRKNPYIGEGFRIKTMKLRGELSQGLALSLKLFKQLQGKEKIGEDVTELLGVLKWELPEVEGSSGTVIGRKPFGIPTTNELRAQSTEILIERLRGKPYYISTKMDGTSVTMYHKDSQTGVTGRNEEYKDDGKNSFWNYAKKNNILENLRRMNHNYALQGEFCGHGIQKNRLRLQQPEYYVFNIYDIDNKKYLDYIDLMFVTEALGIKTVPIEEVGKSFNYTLEELLEKARGKYKSGLDKEGIVIRPLEEEWISGIYNRLSFKVINNDFLMKEK